jgi:hypothetical protein
VVGPAVAATDELRPACTVRVAWRVEVPWLSATIAAPATAIAIAAAHDARTRRRRRSRAARRSARTWPSPFVPEVRGPARGPRGSPLVRARGGPATPGRGPAGGAARGGRPGGRRRGGPAGAGGVHSLGLIQPGGAGRPPLGGAPPGMAGEPNECPTVRPSRRAGGRGGPARCGGHRGDLASRAG